MIRVQVQPRTQYGPVSPTATSWRDRRPVIGTRYQVVIDVCEGMVSDGMWVRLTHAARFADQARAERLAADVLAAVRQSEKDWYEHCLTNGIEAPRPAHMLRDDGRPKWSGLDLRQWVWTPGVTNAFADLQPAPTAKEYDVG